jgi:hypothetical protein
MSEVGHGMLGSATEAFRLRRDFYILDFAFRHSQRLPRNDLNLSIVPHAVNFQDHVKNDQRRDGYGSELLDGHT